MRGGLVDLQIDDIGLYMEMPEEIARELRMLLYLRFL